MISSWKEIDLALRNGARLYCSLTFGAWVKFPDGKSVNANMNAVKAVMRRDLIVICERDSPTTYGYRSKYA